MNITAIATPVEDQLVDIVVVPYFENSELKNEHNINLSEFDDLKKSDVVILAVPHKEFIKEGWRLITKILKKFQIFKLF